MSPRRYSAEPDDPVGSTRRFDRADSSSAGHYDFAGRRLPVWRACLARALPHLRGPRVVERSFGTGWLLGQLADRVALHGVDLDRRMVDVARRNLARDGTRAALVQAAGDLVRDMAPLFGAAGLAYTDEEIGGFGSVHLYVATRRAVAQGVVSDAHAHEALWRRSRP